MIQIATTFLLISGVTLGEFISNSIFGLAKKWYLNILELFLFVVLIIFIFNNIYVKSIDTPFIMVLNFLIGLITIIVTRSIITAGGFFAVKIKRTYKLKSELNEETLIYGLARNLLAKGIGKEDLINILENSGFNKRKIRNILDKTTIYEAEVMGTKRNNNKSS